MANPLIANSLNLEVTRPDEDTVLKTAAGKTVVGSSPTASAF